MNPFTTFRFLITLCSASYVAGSLRGDRELTSGNQDTVYSDIKLTPKNQQSPLRGIANAFGTAEVKLVYRPRQPTGSRWRVCIETYVLGFIPGLLHIHKGKINENGSVVVDFGGLISNQGADVKGCVSVTESIFKDIKMNPDLHYVNTHIAGTPDALLNRGIRGQLIQKFSTKLVGSEQVLPFKGRKGGTGVATIFVESAGNELCIDATVMGFDPALAHLHVGEAGTNGDVSVDFTSLEVAPGRYVGCGTLRALKVASIDTVLSILANPKGYYFNFHAGKASEDAFNVGIRGQLD